MQASYLERLSCLSVGIGRGKKPFCVNPSHRAVHGSALDYGDVVGQEIAKRGLAIAATGGLDLMMIGPGIRQDHARQAYDGHPSSIDELELQEALCIHSVVGERTESLLRGSRPYRNPHHSISSAGLIGGGRPVRPGEISLAHGGVLYLDELGEFSSNTLQMLRQPMEDGAVRIVRVDGAYTFPARFQLIAASNPCPCGTWGTVMFRAGAPTPQSNGIEQSLAVRWPIVSISSFTWHARILTSSSKEPRD